ncbi:MAG: DUF1573 domain-containing protein [Vampirovibrionales bacterium]
MAPHSSDPEAQKYSSLNHTPDISFQPLPVSEFQPSSKPNKAWLQGKPLRWVRRSIALGFILGAVAWSAYVMQTPEQRPLLVDAHQPGVLKAIPMSQHIGTLQMDSKATAHFLLQNVGGKPLGIRKVEPSCGCTAAVPEKTSLAPGEVTPLRITLDTTNKLGDVKKTIDIWATKAKNPLTTITLLAHVEAPAMAKTHHGMVKSKDRLALFKGECATCHVQKGVGKVGEALFVADCAMCHGIGAKGTFAAPGLRASDRRETWDSATYAKHLKEVTTHGSQYNPAMPPFGKQHGGPLTEDDIASLVQYLKVVSMEE